LRWTAGSSSSTSSGLDDKERQVRPLWPWHPGPVYVTGTYRSEGRKFNSQQLLQVGVEPISAESNCGPSLPWRLTAKLANRLASPKIKPSQTQCAAWMLRVKWRQRPRFRDDGAVLIPAVEANVYNVEVNRAELLYIKAIQWGSTDITDSVLDLSNGMPAQTELSVVLGGGWRTGRRKW